MRIDDIMRRWKSNKKQENENDESDNENNDDIFLMIMLAIRDEMNDENGTHYGNGKWCKSFMMIIWITILINSDNNNNNNNYNCVENNDKNNNENNSKNNSNNDDNDNILATKFYIFFSKPSLLDAKSITHILERVRSTPLRGEKQNRNVW